MPLFALNLRLIWKLWKCLEQKAGEGEAFGFPVKLRVLHVLGWQVTKNDGSSIKMIQLVLCNC